MLGETELWVHGSIVEAEYPSYLDELSRKGWGTTFWGKENTVNWFHIPLTTPALLGGVGGGKPKLKRISTLYHNTTRSKIISLHVYDGTRIVMALDGLNLSGDHTKNISSSNSWKIEESKSEIRHGLGVSIGVQFSAIQEQSSPRWILFTTAGAQFSLS